MSSSLDNGITIIDKIFIDPSGRKNPGSSPRTSGGDGNKKDASSSRHKNSKWLPIKIMATFAFIVALLNISYLLRSESILIGHNLSNYGLSLFEASNNATSEKFNSTMNSHNHHTHDSNRLESQNESGKPRKKNEKRMNIVLLYADDWRHDTLSISKTVNPILLTPNIDKLAKQGVRFTHNCVTTSICWISRATLFTGQYMSRHNVTKSCCWVGNAKSEKRIRTPKNFEKLSITSLLYKSGYHVGHVGKWGIWMPFFKYVHFTRESGEWHVRKVDNRTEYITDKQEKDALTFLRDRPRNYSRDNDGQNYYEEEPPFYLQVAFFATHAVDHLKKQYFPMNSSMGWYVNDSIPFPSDGLLDDPLWTKELENHNCRLDKINGIVSMNGSQCEEMVLGPGWESMPPFFTEKNEGRNRWTWRFDKRRKYQRMMKNMYRMATEVDAAVGRIMDELDRQGVRNNTLIIFTADNGMFHGEHGLADKWYPHQESIRVPLVIYDPRMDESEGGKVLDEFTLNLDLAPTILGAAGIERPDQMMGRDMSKLYLSSKFDDEDGGIDIESKSLLGDLSQQHRRHQKSRKHLDQTTWRTEFFYEHPTHDNPSFIPASEALVRKDYKYMLWPDFGLEQLFYLVDDPREMHDLVPMMNSSTNPTMKQHREKFHEMQARFIELKALVKSDQIVTV